MKDYINDYISYNDKIINDGKLFFNIATTKGSEGKTVNIDDNKNIQVIIQEHTNPLNEDKEDRKLLVLNTVPIHRGSFIEYANRNWIVINDVGAEDDNGVYIETKIYPCNNTLKFILPSDHSQTLTIPCIMSNMSLYSIGQDQNKMFITENGKRFITVPYNAQTKEIFEEQRFLLDGDAFKVTEIYKGKVINDIGVLEIKMTQDEINTSKDDLINGIADGLNLHSYKVEILNGSSVSLNYQNKTLQLNVQATDNDVIINNPTIVYTIDNSYVGTVDSNGLITCKGTGTANVVATYNDVSDSIQVNGVMNTTTNNTVVISGQSYIKIGQTSTYTCQFKQDDGTVISKNAYWTIFADDGISNTDLASITSQDYTSCNIKANTNNKLGYIKLKCASVDNQITNTYRIQIKPIL